MKDRLVLYHRGCRDGLGAAWAAWKHFGWDGAKFRSIRFSDGPDRIPDGWLSETYQGRRVFMLDVLPEHEDMVRRLADLHELIVLDHHETAHDQYGDVDWMDYRYSEDESGAVMSWKTFHPGEPVPSVLQYIQDRDLWRHELPDTEAIIEVIHSHPLRFEALDGMAHALRENREQVVSEGLALLRQKDNQIDYMAYSPMKGTDSEGRRVVHVNARSFVSDLGHRLLDDHPDADYAAIWHFRGMDEIKVSLRGREDGPHVGKIAEESGGGGHSEAAGYVTEPQIFGW